MRSLLSALFGKNEKIDFRQLIEEGALIVDVRTAGEFATGSIKGSINIPLDTIHSRLEDLKRKKKTIITCCRSGNRSSMAKSTLSSNGLTVYNGGAWDSLAQKIQ